MTSPNEAVPGGLYFFPVNTGTSTPTAVSGWLAKDQDDWKSDYESGVSNSFDPIGALLATIGDIVSAITGSLGDLADLSTWSDGITGLITAVQDFIQNLLDAILTALQGIPIVGGDLAGIVSRMTGLNTTANNADNTAGHAQSVAVSTTYNVASNKPLRLTTDPSAEPSFSWERLAFPAGGSVPSQTITSSIARIAEIRMSTDQILNTITYMGSRSASQTLYIDLYKFDEDAATWNLLFSSSDQGGNLGTVLDKYTLIFNADGYAAQAGDRFALQFRSNGTVTLASVTFPDGTIGGARNPSPTATPSTISESTMNGYSDGNVIWCEVGSNIAQVATPKMWAVDFNDSSWNGWVKSTDGGELGISSGKVGYSGSTDGYQEAVYGLQTSSDQMEIQFDVDTTSSVIIGGWVCSPNTPDYTNTGVKLVVTTSQCDITTGGTSKVHTTSYHGDGSYRLHYNPSDNTFYAYKYVSGSWVQITSWTDSSHIVPHGAGYRFGGIVIGRSLFTTGGWLDNFKLRDWS